MIDNIRNKLKPFFDKYLLFFLLGFSLLTLLPYVSFFKPLQASYTSGLIYRGILLVIIALFCISLIITYKTRLPIYVWIGCGAYIISQILTILISPIIKNVNVPVLSTIMGLGQALIIGISAISYLSIHKWVSLDRNIINIGCLFMMLFGLLLCLYTYIFEYEDIFHTFNTEYGWNYDVTSIFTMKTEYGFTLLMCSIFSIFYILNNKKYWMYIIPLFFLINMFISRSKTSILCLSIILLSLLIIHIIQLWSKYKRYWIISFVSFATIGITLVVLINLKIGWFEKFNYYITKVIFNDARVVWDDRVHKWSLLLKAVDNPFNIVFGYGERITPLVLSECGCASIGDNIYLSNYGVGGIIKFTLYIVLAVFVIVFTCELNSSIFKKIICLTIQFSFLVCGIFEDDSIVGVTMSGLFSSIIFYSCNKMIKTDFIVDDKVS